LKRPSNPDGENEGENNSEFSLTGGLATMYFSNCGGYEGNNIRAKDEVINY